MTTKNQSASPEVCLAIRVLKRAGIENLSAIAPNPEADNSDWPRARCSEPSRAAPRAMPLHQADDSQHLVLPDAGSEREINSIKIRKHLRNRSRRKVLLSAELFSDPAWDMLLDLTAANLEGQPVAVTSLCYASGVPPTTALRWITRMEEAGMVIRKQDPTDNRRSFLTIDGRSFQQILNYLAEDWQK